MEYKKGYVTGLRVRQERSLFVRAKRGDHSSTVEQRTSANMATMLTACGEKPHLFSVKSVLFPTNIMMTSIPLSALTSSIHRSVCSKEFVPGKKQLIFYLEIPS